MRAIGLLAVTLPLFFGACGGDDAGDVAAVFPDTGLLGRHQQVLVSGDSTSWNASTTVNFGDGVTVDGVQFVSPQALIVDLTIDPTAGEGSRDVTVTDGGDVLTLASAYNLANPITVETDTPLLQGGFGSLKITSHDPDAPFNTTQDPNTGEFTGVDVTGGPGTTIFVDTVSAYEIQVFVEVDVDGASGPLTVNSTDAGTTVVSPGGTLDVTPRTATVLTPGTPATDTLAGSALYEVTAAEAALLTVSVSSANVDAAPNFVLLGPSGKYQDIIAVSNSDNEIVASGDKFFVVVFDNGGLDNYSFDLDATSISLAGVTPVAEVTEPGNNTTAGAQALTGAVSQFNGTLADENDVDFLSLTLTNGQTVRMVATAGPAGATDTEIEIFDSNGTTQLDDIDAGTGEDFEFTAPHAGTFFFRVEASFFATIFGYMPVNDPYTVFVIE